MRSALSVIAWIGLACVPAKAAPFQLSVVDTGQVFGRCDIEIDSGNLPHIAFTSLASARGGYAYIEYARMDSSGAWHAEQAADSANTQACELVLQADNVSHIAYYFKTVSLAHVTNSTGGWTGGSTGLGMGGGDCDIGLIGNSPVFSFHKPGSPDGVAYAFDSGGFTSENISPGWPGCNTVSSLSLTGADPHVAYFECQGAGDDRLQYARRTAPGSWDIETAATLTNGESEDCSLAHGSTGVPTVAFTDTNLGLRVARRGFVWDDEIVDANGQYEVDLALDANGFAHVVYRGLDFELWYAQETSTGWDRQSLTPGVAASNASIAVDASGRPHVVFMSGGDLWYGTVVYEFGPLDAATVAPAAQDHVVRVGFTGGPSSRVELFYRRGGGALGSAYVQSEMQWDGSEFVGTIPASYLGLRGVDYFFRAIAGNDTLTVPALDIDTNPLKIRTTVSGTQTSREVAPGEWRMIGFPFAPTPSTPLDVFAELGPPDDGSWRVSRWSDTIAGYADLGPDDLGPVAPGQGFWIHVRQSGQTLGPPGISTLASTSGSYKVLLESGVTGWNMISNPFAFPVAWADVGRESGVEDGLWMHDGSQYWPANTLEPGRGYWVRNRAASPRVLTVPYRETIASRNRAASVEGTHWSVRLGLEAGIRFDLWNILGRREGAHDALDAFDLSEPPPSHDFVRLASLVENREREWGLAEDWRSPSPEGAMFKVRVSGNVPGPASLRIVASTLPAGAKVLLVDERHSASYLLSEEPTFILPDLEPLGREYWVAVGDSEFLEDLPEPRERVEALNIAVSPNPVRSVAEIRFATPRTAWLSLRILDVRGRVVRTLARSEFAAGPHQLVWDGMDGQGRSAASGVYFVSLSMKESHVGQRIVLIR